jgi:hypothetical protein
MNIFENSTKKIQLKKLFQNNLNVSQLLFTKLLKFKLYKKKSFVFSLKGIIIIIISKQHLKN